MLETGLCLPNDGFEAEGEAPFTPLMTLMPLTRDGVTVVLLEPQPVCKDADGADGAAPYEEVLGVVEVVE